MNLHIIVGRLGKDPDLRYTGKGTAVCNFSVATSDGYGENKKTNWHNVVTWQKLAEVCKEHLHKGSQVAVVGRVEISSYTDKDQNKRYKTELVAEKVEFLGGSASTTKSDDTSSDDTSSNSDTNDPTGLDDDIPF